MSVYLTQFFFYSALLLVALTHGLSSIGEPCGIPSDCQGPSTTCLNSGVCDCSGGSVPMENLIGCLLPLNFLGENCTEAAQCQHGTPGPFSDCVLPHPSVNSSQTICNCTADAVSGISGVNMNKCYKKATYLGDPCQSQLQCISNIGLSQCLEGKCECLSIAMPANNNTRCLAAVDFLNDTCEANIQCTVPNSICLPVTRRDRTLPAVIEAANQSCSESIQCTEGLGSFAECQENLCQCVNDTVFYGSLCYAKKKLGDDCGHDDECKANIQGGVTCKFTENSGVCSCDDVTFQDGDTLCKPILEDNTNAASLKSVSNFLVVLILLGYKFL
ncbi:unnamed protein product [Orchesella dallaii]|uniref:Prion-like-(Q/N-rich) domain-bearing protein 25 n=1 Tax=Orchesella dallaii TaxID=48710 RepID=A0ABP1S7G9_9HEXA